MSPNLGKLLFEIHSNSQVQWFDLCSVIIVISYEFIAQKLIERETSIATARNGKWELKMTFISGLQLFVMISDLNKNITESVLITQKSSTSGNHLSSFSV